MNRTGTRHRVRIVASALGVVALLGLTGCAAAAASSTPAAGEQPAKVESIGTAGLKKLTLTERAVQRLAVTTEAVTTDAVSGKLVIPYASLLYLPNGTPFVYTNPEPRVYVRHDVAVETITGDTVVLTAGPPAGTQLVTAGGAELWGTEFGVK